MGRQLHVLVGLFQVCYYLAWPGLRWWQLSYSTQSGFSFSSYSYRCVCGGGVQMIPSVTESTWSIWSYIPCRKAWWFISRTPARPIAPSVKSVELEGCNNRRLMLEGILSWFCGTFLYKEGEGSCCQPLLYYWMGVSTCRNTWPTNGEIIKNWWAKSTRCVSNQLCADSWWLKRLLYFCLLPCVARSQKAPSAVSANTIWMLSKVHMSCSEISWTYRSHCTGCRHAHRFIMIIWVCIKDIC